MRATSLVFFLAIGLGDSLNRGRARPKLAEIAYGTAVDYDSVKQQYPFMARLVMDDELCGGVVIADRSDSAVFKADNEHAFLAAKEAQAVTLSISSICVSLCS